MDILSYSLSKKENINKQVTKYDNILVEIPEYK